MALTDNINSSSNPPATANLSKVQLPNDETKYLLRDSIFSKLGLSIQNGQVVQTYLVDEEEGE